MLWRASGGATHGGNIGQRRKQADGEHSEEDATQQERGEEPSSPVSSEVEDLLDRSGEVLSETGLAIVGLAGRRRPNGGQEPAVRGRR
jgi:hypothetical protein